jgi:hypothetical protein
VDTVTRFMQSKSFWFVSSLLLTLTLLLSACGNAGTSTGSSASSPTPQPTVSQTQATADGCPTKTTVGSLPPANVTLKSAQANATVSANPGDIIELDMAFGHNWQNPMVVPAGLLNIQSTAGSVSTTAKACIWRFTATGAGTVQINFTGRPICGMGQLCPAYIINIPFTVKIK